MTTSTVKKHLSSWIPFYPQSVDLKKEPGTIKVVAVLKYTLEELVNQSIKDLIAQGVLRRCTYTIQDCNEYLEIEIQWYNVYAEYNSAKITVKDVNTYIEEITKFISISGHTNESSRARVHMKVLETITSCIHHFESPDL